MLLPPVITYTSKFHLPHPHWGCYTRGMANCHFCKTEIPSGTVIGYASVCSACARPLKICLNCRFWDPGAYHECREGIDEPVIYKDVANFCDFFVLKEESHSAQQEARTLFDSLFNDES